MKMSKNNFIRMIQITIAYIILTVMMVPAIPYAIVKGLINLDYYEEWKDHIFNCIFSIFPENN